MCVSMWCSHALLAERLAVVGGDDHRPVELVGELGDGLKAIRRFSS